MDGTSQTRRWQLSRILTDYYREPLCKFIGKPVPNTPFPNGNIASEFGPKLMTVDEERFRHARRNAAKVGAVFAAVVGVGIYGLMWRKGISGLQRGL